MRMERGKVNRSIDENNMTVETYKSSLDVLVSSSNNDLIHSSHSAINSKSRISRRMRLFRKQHYKSSTKLNNLSGDISNSIVPNMGTGESDN